MSRAIVLLGFLIANAALANAQLAQDILLKAKQATGGDAWDTIRTMHIHEKTDGLSGPGQIESWTDNLSGRKVTRFQSGGNSMALGFDGQVVWFQDASGQPRVEGAESARKAAIDNAYRDCFGYWFPQRWPAQIEYSGEKEDERQVFHVINITPKGGQPFDVWINASTYVIDRITEKFDGRTTYFSDYRQVDGVKIPFAERSTNGEAKYDQYITVEKIELNAAVQETMFRMPAPPPPDFSIAGDKASTAMPFDLINNHIYVQVKLNGEGPFRVICDTGGGNVITPAVANELQMKSERGPQVGNTIEKNNAPGLVKIKRLQLGEAVINNQLFGVAAALGTYSHVEGVEVSGVIGYEVFRRFIVKLDYENHVLTLIEPSAFIYKVQGTKLPFVFNGHLPEVDGDIDGIPGKFEIDTGSRTSLDMMKPFVEKHDLVSKYGAKIEAVTGWGSGGIVRSLVTRVKVLRLGTIEVHKPVTDLFLQPREGFTGPYVAGFIGTGVLKHFNITLDYPHQQLIMEPNASYDKPDVHDRSGMWINQADGMFEVIDVVVKGPAAAAGIKAGDEILAVDGRAAQKISLSELRNKLRSKPGTKVRLTIRSGQQQREAQIVLRELV